jgi:hypothetical protein
VLDIMDTLRRAREKLHEQRIRAVLDQVRDIGVAQAVQRHAVRQAERVAVLGEPGADLLQ